MTIDNSSFQHKALIQLALRLAYYPPSDEAEAAAFDNDSPIQNLKAKNNNGSASRAQYYLLSEERHPGADDSRYVLMNPGGMAMFQPCEALFQCLKYRMARSPSSISNESHVQCAHAQAVELLIKTTCNDDVRNCVREV